MTIPSRYFTNPNLPAGALIQTLEDGLKVFNDGSAEKHDGTKLKSRFSHDWYLLSITYGEARHFNDETHRANTRIWNGWICRDLPQEQREFIAKQMNIDPQELRPLDTDELRSLETLWSELSPTYGVPNISYRADFIDTYIPHGFFKGFVFLFEFVVVRSFGSLNLDHMWVAGAKFANCDFVWFSCESVQFYSQNPSLLDQTVEFENCQFTYSADFRHSTFQSPTRFVNCAFESGINCDHAEFQQMTTFKSCSFGSDNMNSGGSFRDLTTTQWVTFYKCNFMGNAQFQRAAFSYIIDFPETAFQTDAQFQNCIFKDMTDFSTAQFRNDVPKFFEAQLHQNTKFCSNKLVWPIAPNSKWFPQQRLEDNKAAYERLKHEMNKLQKTDDENFFYRQELRCKALLDPWYYRPVYWIYDRFSDNGYSVARPAAWLLCLIILFWGFYGSVFRNDPELAGITSPILDGFVISLGNTLPFLAIGNTTYAAAMAQLPAWLKLFAAIQSLLGIVLLFFLGLGLRTRFRWR